MKRRYSHPAAAALLVAAAAILLPACDSKPTEPGASNPFDPDGPDPFNLTAFYQNGDVGLSWREITGPTITGFSIFRRTDRETIFARIDTAEATATEWIDPDPAYFTRSVYRIAAIGASGAESDTAGRGIDTIGVPPLFAVSGGSVVTQREIVLNLGAAGADSMIVWALNGADSIPGPASWEPFSETKPWTLDSGFDTTFFFSILARDGGELSDTLTAVAAPAHTEGSLELAGGDSLVARALLEAQLGGAAVTRLLLSEDMVFGDDGDDSLLFVPGDTLVTPDTSIFWQFDTEPVPKTLFGRFENDFGVDTIAADTVWPDSLRDIALVLADGETTVDRCEFGAFLSANATLMNPVPGFPPGGWRTYDSSFTFVLPDTTAGDFVFEVLLSNDFFSSSPAPARDTVTFAPIEMAVAITSPAPPETTITALSDTTIDTTGVEPDTAIAYTTFVDGDAITVQGSNVAASCTARPDSVAVRIGSAAEGRIRAVASWSFEGVIAESAGDTTLIDIVASAVDEKGSMSSDTVTVQVAPAASKK